MESGHRNVRQVRAVEPQQEEEEEATERHHEEGVEQEEPRARRRQTPRYSTGRFIVSNNNKKKLLVSDGYVFHINVKNLECHTRGTANVCSCRLLISFWAIDMKRNTKNGTSNAL